MDMLDDPNGAFGYGSLIYDGTYLYGMTNNGGEEKPRHYIQNVNGWLRLSKTSRF
jgi:hypothetical protein